MQYFRIAPTPCVNTSQPASVSIGEPQLPSLMNSHGCAGASRIFGSAQKWMFGGKHEQNIFVVLSRKHGELPVDFARKQRHALVLHGRAVERAEFEMHEIRRLQQLRQRDLAIVSRVGRVVGESAVVVLKTHEARVLDAVALAGRGRKQHALGNLAVRREVHFVIGFGQQQDSPRRPHRRGVGSVRQAGRQPAPRAIPSA